MATLLLSGQHAMEHLPEVGCFGDADCNESSRVYQSVVLFWTQRRGP